MNTPLESGLRSLKETPLRALQTGGVLYSKLIWAMWVRNPSNWIFPLTWYGSASFMPYAQGALIGPTIFFSGPINIEANIPFHYNPVDIATPFDPFSADLSDPSQVKLVNPYRGGSKITIGPSDVTSTTDTATTFGTQTGLGGMLPGYNYNIGGPYPYYEATYNAPLKVGHVNIFAAMCSNESADFVGNIFLPISNPSLSDAYGEIFFVSALDGSETLISNWNWQTGFDALGGQFSGNIPFDVPNGGGRIKVTFNSLNFQHGSGSPNSLDNSIVILLP